ncbi:MAG: DUF4190 domain-containing protein [Lachnospiraceae bacterium]|nr:DUF4190 domain-containing protein [Lachnospiraceae bacterium]
MNRNYNGLSVAALMLGIFGLLTMCCGGSIVFGSLAIILAWLSRDTSMNGQAKTALGIGCVGLIGGIFMVTAVLLQTAESPEFRDTMEDYMRYYSDMYDREYDDGSVNPYDDILRYFEQNEPLPDSPDGGTEL